MNHRWPGRFDCETSIHHGWLDLVEETNEPVDEAGELVKRQQIKEKFGAIRMYFPNGPVGLEVVRAAEELSLHACEICGQPGAGRADQLVSHLVQGARRQMRIWIFSDLHLGNAALSDRQEVWYEVPKADIALVPGDIVENPDIGAGWLAEHVRPHMPVVWLLGNHEFYHGDFATTRRAAREASERHDLILLDDDTLVTGGVRIIGSTLWTNYDLYNPTRDGDIRERYMGQARRSMLDHRLIRREGQQFRPDDALAQHRESRIWLEARLAEPFDGATIVTTHHAPHPGSVHRDFAGDPLTPAFVSDLSETIEKFQPELWVHGHTHAAFDYTVGRTRLICNPRGYRHERRNGFRDGLVVEV